jgi:hypothetical protein
MVEQALDFSAYQPDAAYPRYCSTPIRTVSRSPGLAVRSRSGMAEPLRVPPYVPAVPSSGEPCRVEPRGGMAEPLRVPPYVPAVLSSGEPCRVEPRGGMVEPLCVPPYVPAAPSSGEPCRVEPRSGFHRSVPAVAGEAISRSPRVASPAAPGPLLCASSGSFTPHRRPDGCEFRLLRDAGELFGLAHTRTHHATLQ